MIEVKLPDIGEGIAEGEIVKWCVQPGDTVAAEAPLLEVLTDKAAVEIPAPSAGVVHKLMFAEGDLVPVGQVIVQLSAPGSSPEPESAAPTAETPAAHVAVAPVQTASGESHGSERPPATPAIRRAARKQGIDLQQVKGSGPYGRILQRDLASAPAAAAPTTSPAPADTAPAAASKESGTANETRVPLRGIRRKIAEQMVKAKFTAPDFLYADEADLSELVAFRKAMAAELTAEGIKLTYLPFIVKAVVSALKKYPSLNASLDEDSQELVYKHDYHIGMATASPNGLFVPVIHHADRKSLIELAQEIETLASAVREGKATPEMLRGGTFTITNIGAIGGLMSAPIINHPEVAIMGVNKIYQKPMVYNDEIAIRWACTLSLSFDHRVVDGSDGAYFTSHIIRLLQNPRRLLLEA
ncbi:MAG: 2-oxo acid dehydrogenase subunit E2 [Candidatus Sericytochromatia bacterium]|nr:2-oxo acid dehydrogenase subunit E2 [Candidatus Sericytochromatia bacterium]